MITVLTVDDDQLMRAGLTMIIEQSADISVVAEAANGLEAISAVRQHHPDVVLMDVRMPEMNGIEATSQICAGHEPPRILILTTFELDEYVFEALRAGASGFLLKRSPPDVLLDGIRTVASGEGLLSPSVTRRLIEEFSSQKPTRTIAGLGGLTTRELEVLVEMAKGRSNDEIGESLFIAENTVKTHVKRVLSKLGARDRVQAVVAAYESGLMDG